MYSRYELLPAFGAPRTPVFPHCWGVMIICSEAQKKLMTHIVPEELSVLSVCSFLRAELVVLVQSSRLPSSRSIKVCNGQDSLMLAPNIMAKKWFDIEISRFIFRIHVDPSSVTVAIALLREVKRNAFFCEIRFHTSVRLKSCLVLLIWLRCFAC